MDVGERYVVGPLIGEGATAVVHEAEDTTLHRRVAVKVFRDPDVGDHRSERIGEEVRILTSLGHPHLLPLYDTGRNSDGRRFIVMPLVRGTTLAKQVSRGPLAPAEVKCIATALAAALAHIHARGIVHRDVKPSNVLLAEDGTAYLADFGFARAADGPALTTTNCVVGTAGYLAPEQAEGIAVTPAVDVYALGLVLLEALTGEREYQGTPLERATANALRPPRIPARLGAGWLAALRAMTAKDPSARPTADEVSVLVAAAEDVLPEVSAVDPTMELPPATGSGGRLAFAGPEADVASASSATAAAASDARSPHRRRRLTILGAAALTAAAVGGLGSAWLFSGAAGDTHTPTPLTPGFGASGSRQSTTPPQAPATVTVDPGSMPAVAPPPQRPADQSLPQQSAPSTKCQPADGHDDKGHSKHKCPGDADKGH